MLHYRFYFFGSCPHSIYTRFSSVMGWCNILGCYVIPLSTPFILLLSCSSLSHLIIMPPVGHFKNSPTCRPLYPFSPSPLSPLFQHPLIPEIEILPLTNESGLFFFAPANQKPLSPQPEPTWGHLAFLSTPHGYSRIFLNPCNSPRVPTCAHAIVLEAMKCSEAVCKENLPWFWAFSHH